MSATMRVSELVGKLSTFDPDLLVEVCNPGEPTRHAPVLVLCPVTAGTDALTALRQDKASVLAALGEAVLKLNRAGNSIPENGEDPDRTCERYDAAIARYERALAEARALTPEVGNG